MENPAGILHNPPYRFLLMKQFRGVAEKFLSLVNFLTICILNNYFFYWIAVVRFAVNRSPVNCRSVFVWWTARSILLKTDVHFNYKLSERYICVVWLFSRVAYLSDTLDWCWHHVDIITLVSISVKTCAKPYRLWIQRNILNQYTIRWVHW